VISPPSSGTTISEVAKVLREKGGLRLRPGAQIRCGEKKPKWDAIYRALERHSQIEYQPASPNFKIMLFAIQNLSIIKQLDAICAAPKTHGLYTEIRKIDGIGAFMAGQICVDIGYIDKELFDENELAPAGPGCIKGLNYLHKGSELNPESATAAQEEKVQSLLKNIRDKQELIWKHFNFSAPTFGTMSLMTIEILMCDASKYISLTLDPKTKGRQRYRQRPRVEQVAPIVAAFSDDGPSFLPSFLPPPPPPSPTPRPSFPPFFLPSFLPSFLSSFLPFFPPSFLYLLCFNSSFLPSSTIFVSSFLSFFPSLPSSPPGVYVCVCAPCSPKYFKTILDY
jgi:hypothetical protein